MIHFLVCILKRTRHNFEKLMFYYAGSLTLLGHNSTTELDGGVNGICFKEMDFIIFLKLHPSWDDGFCLRVK